MNKKLMCNSAIISLCALFAIFGPVRDAFAQARKPPAAAAAAGATVAGQTAGREGVAVKLLEITKLRTPDFSYSGSSVNEANIIPGEWAKILVRFDTDADWADQLEMRFYIAVKNPKTATYTMFTGTYVYSDIPKGRGHQVAVFLRPRTMERYGNMVEQAAVEIYSKGELVSARSIPESNKPWWRTATVRSVEGYVIERSQTPFANIASDNYEIPKGK